MPSSLSTLALPQHLQTIATDLINTIEFTLITLTNSHKDIRTLRRLVRYLINFLSKLYTSNYFYIIKSLATVVYNLERFTLIITNRTLRAQTILQQHISYLVPILNKIDLYLHQHIQNQQHITYLQNPSLLPLVISHKLSNEFTSFLLDCLTIYDYKLLLPQHNILITQRIRKRAKHFFNHLTHYIIPFINDPLYQHIFNVICSIIYVVNSTPLFHHQPF